MKIENEYQRIISRIKEIHSQFLGKYSKIIDKNIANSQMFKDSTYSKLSFVGKILKDSGVIKNYCEHDVDVAGNSFTRSVVLELEYPFSPIFILNGANDVFVYEGVTNGESIHLRAFDNNGDFKPKKFSNVLQDDFDWEKFILYVVDLVHKNAYKRRDLIEQLFG